MTETNASNGDRFKFAGMEYDATAGQYYDHARWFSNEVGRFVTPDPLGFAAGDANVYRYVSNDPTAATDPSGEDPATAMILLFILGGGLLAFSGCSGAFTPTKLPPPAVPVSPYFQPNLDNYKVTVQNAITEALRNPNITRADKELLEQAQKCSTKPILLRLLCHLRWTIPSLASFWLPPTRTSTRSLFG